MTNVYFKDALLRARERVAVGTSLADSLQQSRLFPPMVIHMVRIGEESGNLEKMLDIIALLRCLSDLGLGEVLIPEVHPIAKRHVRL